MALFITLDKKRNIFEHVKHCYSGSIDLIDMHRRSNIRRRVAFTHIADQLRCQDVAKQGFISQQENHAQSFDAELSSQAS